MKVSNIRTRLTVDRLKKKKSLAFNSKMNLQICVFPSVYHTGTQGIIFSAEF